MKSLLKKEKQFSEKGFMGWSLRLDWPIRNPTDTRVLLTSAIIIWFESHVWFRSPHSSLSFLSFFHSLILFFFFSLPTNRSIVSAHECGLLIQQIKMGAESQIPRSLIHRIYASLANEFHFALPVSSSRTNELELVRFSLSLSFIHPRFDSWIQFASSFNECGNSTVCFCI